MRFATHEFYTFLKNIFYMEILRIIEGINAQKLFYILKWWWFFLTVSPGKHVLNVCAKYPHAHKYLQHIFSYHDYEDYVSYVIVC